MKREWLRRARKKAKKNQQDVADALRIDASSVSLIESGKRQIRLDELPKISAVIGLSVREIMVAEGIDLDPPIRRDMLREIIIGATQAFLDTETKINPENLAIVVMAVYNALSDPTKHFAESDVQSSVATAIEMFTSQPLSN